MQLGSFEYGTRTGAPRPGQVKPRADPHEPGDTSLGKGLGACFLQRRRLSRHRRKLGLPERIAVVSKLARHPYGGTESRSASAQRVALSAKKGRSVPVVGVVIGSGLGIHRGWSVAATREEEKTDP